LPPDAERRRRPSAFPGKDGGLGKNFFRDAEARGLAERELPKIKGALHDEPDLRT
jgi:hypothetical protein